LLLPGQAPHFPSTNCTAVARAIRVPFKAFKHIQTFCEAAGRHFLGRRNRADTRPTQEQHRRILVSRHPFNLGREIRIDSPFREGDPLNEKRVFI
jgi:hypothetical protein